MRFIDQYNLAWLVEYAIVYRSSTYTWWCVSIRIHIIIMHV